NGNCGALYRPSSSAITVREAPVSVFVNLMLTPGRTAPAESLTVPVIVPVVTCAIAMPPKSNRQEKSLNPSCLRIMRFLPILPTQNWPPPCTMQLGRPKQNQTDLPRMLQQYRTASTEFICDCRGGPRSASAQPQEIDRPYSLYLPRCGSRGPGGAWRDGIHAQAVVGIGIDDSLISNPVAVLVDPA